MKFQKIYTYRSFYTIYFIALYFYILKIIRPELHYNVQQPPFLANTFFFKEYLDYPGGLLEYAAMFLSQFFYYPWVGSLVITFMGILLLILIQRTARFFGIGHAFLFLFFIPVILYFALFNNYLFPFTAALYVLSGFFFFRVYTVLQKRKYNPFLFFTLLGLIAYYSGGIGSYAVFALSVLFETLFLGSVKKSVPPVLFFIIFSGVIPYVSFKYIFNISLEKAYLGFIPDLPRNLTFEPGYIFQLFKFCLPLLVLAFLVLRRILRKKNAGKIQAAEPGNKFLSDTPEQDPKIPAVLHSSAPVFFLNIAIILILSFLVLQKTRNSSVKNVVLVDYYTYTGQWNNAIRTSLAEPSYSASINYNYNRAIDQKGVFIDKFFDFPQRVGPNILPPNKNKGAVISILCSDYYYDLGYMSEAMHWAHEAHTLLPYSPRVLKRMVKVNLVIGNYKTAGKYLNVLGENFLNRDFVAAYSPYIEDTTLVARDTEIMAKRELMPHGFVVDADNSYHQLLAQNPDNKRAFEHMMVRYLLEHDLETFLNTINRGKKFYTAGTPSLYQEAYMIYLLEHNPSAVSASKLDVRNRNTLNNYSRILQKYNNNTEAAKAEMHKYIGDTYLYYILYYKPGN